MKQVSMVAESIVLAEQREETSHGVKGRELSQNLKFPSGLLSFF